MAHEYSRQTRRGGPRNFARHRAQNSGRSGVGRGICRRPMVGGSDRFWREGMVVKPLQFVARNKRGLIQSSVKCRGKEYFRIIYDANYSASQYLDLLRFLGL